MNPRIRIGILTPSSNTALEPLTTAIVAGLPDVSVHFARFTVTEIRHARRPKGAGRVSSSLSASSTNISNHAFITAQKSTGQARPDARATITTRPGCHRWPLHSNRRSQSPLPL